MPTALVILPSNTYRAADFIAAAESLGVDLIVASERPPPMDMGDRYVLIDCADPVTAGERIAHLGETVRIDGVIAADDQGVLVAAHACALLGLSGNTVDAAAATRDKLLMRRRLAAAEVDQPGFAPLAPADSPDDVAHEVGFPLVMKPLDRSASQGVIRVDRYEEVGDTARRIRGIVGPDATLLVESFVAGVEIAIEGMLTDGKLIVLAMFDKPDTSSGPYFPETLFVTPSRLLPDALVEAERVAASAITALGLTSGPVHIEMRIQGTRAQVIEVAARSIGGLCSRSLSFGLMGTTLESLIIRNALGLDRIRLRREPMASGVLMIPTPGAGRLRAITGVEETRSIRGITGLDLSVVPGNILAAPPEGDRYVGFVYARGQLPDQVEAALREAMATLEVQLEG